jgi:hypothetical protein
MNAVKNKIIMLVMLTGSTLLVGCASGSQVVRLSKEERNEVKILFSFLGYLQKTPVQEVDQNVLCSQYLAVVPSDSIRQVRFKGILAGTKEQLKDMNLRDYAAVPWPKYPFPDKLPRLVDDAEPITHIMGEPIKQKARPTAEEKKAFREQILVVYEKDNIGQPAFYALFDKKSGKIAAWVMIKQGEYHYFLTY